MTVATYVFEVNWAGDATAFGNGTWVAETDRLIDLECGYGRDYASMLTGRASAGFLSAVMHDDDGRYASFNTASALTGNLVPGRRCRWRTTAPSARTIWAGFLDVPVPVRRRGVLPTATLRAYGPLRWVAERDVRIAAQASIATGTAVGLVLDDTGWPAADRAIDAGQVTMTRWAADSRAMSALRDLEETELGFISETNDGKIVFEDVHHLLVAPHQTSQATFSDAVGAALPYLDIQQLDPWREVFNRFEADVITFTVQGAAALWTMTGETPSIAAGVTKEFWAVYPTPDAATQGAFVTAWTTPVATTDYTANAAADGSGADLTASITVVVTKFSNAMKIALTNGHASSTAYMTLLQARGTAAYRNDPIRVVAEDTTSQAAYGRRTYPLPGKYYPDTPVALSYAQYGRSLYKDPTAVLALAYRADQSSAHMTQALTRDVSERITVVASGTAQSGALLGLSRDFYIEAVRHKYNLREHVVRYELADASKVGGYWSLGNSLLGTGTRLSV